MKAGRGSSWLGWAALLVGVVIGGARGAEVTAVLTYTTGNSGAQVHSSPAIGPDGTIYIGVRHATQAKGALLAIDPRTQAMKAGWRPEGFVPKDWVDSSPALSRDGAVVYCSSVDGFLYAIDASNGREIWSRRVGISSYSSPAVGEDGSVYVGSGGVDKDSTSGDNGVHAFTPGGAEIWPTFKTEYRVNSSPAIAPDGTLYFGSFDGRIYAVNSNGTQKWVQTAPVSAIVSSPAIGADGTVYVGSFDGYLYALAPEDGRVKWRFATDSGIWIEASPAIGPDGAIYFGDGDGQFYAVKPDGTRKWEPITAPRRIISSAVVRSDGVIIFGADDGLIRAVDADNARIVWTHNTRARPAVITEGEEIESSPVISPVDGTVYVGSMNGKLYGLAGSGTGAPVSGYSPWPMHRRDVQHTGRKPAQPDGGRLSNLSTRVQAGNGATLIAGLAAAGTGPKPYLIRAVGPTLTSFGISAPLRDPTLAIKRNDFGDVLFANDNWGSEGDAAQLTATAARVGAFPLPAGSKDAVVLPTLAPGLYTASVGSPEGDAGIALVEAYDADVGAPAGRLINLSVRAQAGVGESSLIVGFVITGPDPLRVLTRAVGPGLAAFGVGNFLARPTMTVRQKISEELRELRTNAGWTAGLDSGDIAGASVAAGAFSLAPGSADCAALLTLSPGSYTIQVSGAGGTTGEALVEVYVLP
ncbi:MAG: PQQ-binding-like beta-propeller repeat protein [Verrucomicrobia bacterium]|nr:PQQ-binding-like beta-propeller repeat protein [Verrucomicrobiota bacterium]